MIKDYLQIRTLSIVFIGEFNPAIIQPYWLVNKKLIRESEAEQTDLDLVHKELARYDLKWCILETSKTRFELRTSMEPYFEPLKDLAVSIFEILNETPVKALGINNICHYALPDQDKYFNFGNKLAPLDFWDSLNDPRLLQLDVIEDKRKDGLEGYYRIRVQPSDQKLSTRFGVSINVNDHYGLKSGESGRNGEILNVLRKNWKPSLQRAEQVPEDIWSKINK